MAVQAHKSDYSSHQQQIGYVDNQSSSHVLFSNGVLQNNSRKRGRETNNGALINPISSLRRPQFIDLELLHQQQNVVSTGLHLSFTDQNKKQSSFSSLFSENIENQIKQQSQEIDHLIHAQEQLLRRMLVDERQKQYHALVTAAEESAAMAVRDKEVEAEKAKRRNTELESRAAQLSIESQVWQSKIREQEATAAALESQLQNAITTVDCMYKYHVSNRAVEGDYNRMQTGHVVDDAESANIEPVQTSGPVVPVPVCKGCWRRGATVVVFPCRHLCVCTGCDSGLKACPVCLVMKTLSVEVRFS